MMTFDLVPDNSEVSAILASSVQGMYRVVHDAMKPYVYVQPAEPRGSITVRAIPQLQLLRRASSRQVHGRITFVMMMNDGGTQMVEVLQPSSPLDSVIHEMQLGHIDAYPTAEGEVPGPLQPRTHTPRVAPEPPMPEPPRQRPIPAAWKALCSQADVHPELGDYLVIPEAMSVDDPPPWVVRSPHVQAMHVVKRRLGTDDILASGIISR